MDAYFEIIEKLVKSVPSQTWLEQNHFPFKFLESPQANVYDICIFDTNAQGAYGFLWIKFKNVEDLLIFPFNLARHKEDGDLISMSPWSLKNASFDSKFFESWRTIQKQRNPIITAKMATFYHKKHDGESGFIATNIWSDTKNTCIRLDFQIAYKIFKTLEKKYPQSIEVEFLTYLGSQSNFSNFAKLISVFEYNSKEYQKSNVAIGMRYIQNNGSLFPYFVSLLHKARFPQKFKERIAQNSWQELLQLAQSLGRLLGDFHKAMALAPRQSELAPEKNTRESNKNWYKIVCEKLDERLNLVISKHRHNEKFSNIIHLLPEYALKIKEHLLNLDDTGLRIRVHGHIHLGQIILGMNDLVLLDYDADDVDNSKYRRIKQPCLKDFVSMIISIRFAWLFTEREYYSDLSDQTPIENNMKIEANSKDNIPSLKELEFVFTKFYKNSLEENITSNQLKPSQLSKEKILYNFCFFMRILKEIAREIPEGNPRSQLWLQILQDFMMYENAF